MGGLPVVGPQDRARVQRREHLLPARCLEQLPAVGGDPERRAHQRLARGRAEQHDELRLHRLELRAEPGTARPHLERVGAGVDAALAADREPEVLPRFSSRRVVLDYDPGVEIAPTWTMAMARPAAPTSDQPFDRWADLARFARPCHVLIRPNGEVDAAFARFSQKVLSNLAESTSEQYALQLKIFMNFLLSGRDKDSWESVTRFDLEAFEYFRRRSPANESRVGGSAWITATAALRRFFAWATRQGYFEVDPFVASDLVGIAKPSDAGKRRVQGWLTRRAYQRWRTYTAYGVDNGALSAEPLEAVLDSPGTAERRSKGRTQGRLVAFTDLCWSSGLRSREASTLLLPELTLDQRTQVHVGQIAEMAKGSKFRYFYVTGEAVDSLRSYLSLERSIAVSGAQGRGAYETLPDRLDVVAQGSGAEGVVLTFRDAVGKTRKRALWELTLSERKRLFRRTDEGLEPLWFWLTEAGLPIADKRHFNIQMVAASKRATRAGFAVHVTPHVLRHSFALHMLIQAHNSYSLAARLGPAARTDYERSFGNAWEMVRQLLGHSSVETTKQFYLGPIQSLRTEELLAMSQSAGALGLDEILRVVAARDARLVDA